MSPIEVVPIFSSSHTAASKAAPSPERLFHLAYRILSLPGGYVPVRTIQRRCLGFSAANIRQLMQDLTTPVGHPSHLGQFIEIKKARKGRSLKVFYKCPPNLVTEEALAKFSMSLEEYKRAFQSKLVEYRYTDQAKDEEYLAELQANDPYMAGGQFDHKRGDS